MNVPNYEGIISNAHVYGLSESVKASKYPMSVNVKECSETATERTYSLAGAPIGSGHDNFLNGITVQFDLTFTCKAWIELQRYHFIDFVSSQSTMHRITKMDLESAYCEYVDRGMIEIMQRLVSEYNANPTAENYLRILYSNPAGMKLTARMTTNYRQLKTIYAQRHNHRLPEWQMFCKWIDRALPMGHEWICGYKSGYEGGESK